MFTFLTVESIKPLGILTGRIEPFRSARHKSNQQNSLYMKIHTLRLGQGFVLKKLLQEVFNFMQK